MRLDIEQVIAQRLAEGKSTATCFGLEHLGDRRILSKNGSTLFAESGSINEGDFFNNVYFDVNKVSTVFGKKDLRGYIRRQIADKNLVRIKNRGPNSSDSPALIAAEYADVTSSEEAADQTAMASYDNSIRTTSENSQEKSSANGVQRSVRENASQLCIGGGAHLCLLVHGEPYGEVVTERGLIGDVDTGIDLLPRLCGLAVELCLGLTADVNADSVFCCDMGCESFSFLHL